MINPRSLEVLSNSPEGHAVIDIVEQVTFETGYVSVPPLLCQLAQRLVSEIEADYDSACMSNRMPDKYREIEDLEELDEPSLRELIDAQYQMFGPKVAWFVFAQDSPLKFLLSREEMYLLGLYGKYQTLQRIERIELKAGCEPAKTAEDKIGAIVMTAMLENARASLPYFDSFVSRAIDNYQAALSAPK